MASGAATAGRGRRPKLIEAVVGAADRGEPSPPELRLWHDCQATGALPYAGGLLDQPLALWLRMRYAGGIYQTVKRWRGAKGKQIHSLPGDIVKMAKWLTDEGYLRWN